MLEIFRQFRAATLATKNFWFTLAIYHLAIIISTAYVYYRLENDRTGYREGYDRRTINARDHVIEKILDEEVR